MKKTEKAKKTTRPRRVGLDEIVIRPVRSRNLLDGTSADEYEKCTRVTISSKCPGKWKFCDMETGQVWKWENGAFKATMINFRFG